MTAESKTLDAMLHGKWISQAISVAAELGVADLLAAGPRPSAEIARSLEASPDAVHRLCRALASLGVLAESEGSRFGLTAMGQYLRSDVPRSLRGWARFVGSDATWQPWGRLAYSIRTGRPAFDEVFGEPAFDYLDDHPDVAAVLNDAMTSISQTESLAVVDAYDFAGIGTLVDVGGGHGHLLATVLAAHPAMRGILFELPHAVEGARALLAETGVAERCEVVGGDFLGPVPEGGDAYALKHIVHDWDDERAAKILRNCHRAMRPGGRLLVVEAVVPTGPDPHYAKLLDLEMLVMTPGGRERTEAEFRALFERGGFRLERIVPTEADASIVEGVRA